MSRSPLALAALATVAMPGLDVVAARPPAHPGPEVDETSILDSEGRRWMVRAPRSAAAGAAMEAELALLATLALAHDDGRLVPDVPRPEGFAPLEEGGRAMVYRELLGRPLRMDRLGSPAVTSAVARALASLHELPDSVIADAGLPVYDAESYRLRRLSDLDEAARTGHVPPVLLRRWEAALEDVRLWRFRATPIHGDLAAEHLILNEGEVIGMLDWGEARVADPADDLAWLLAAAPLDAAEALLEAYAAARTAGADEHLADRAQLAGELALVRWLMVGVHRRDDEIIDDAVAMLRELAGAVEDAPEIGESEPVVVPVELAEEDAFDDEDPDDVAADDAPDDEDAEATDGSDDATTRTYDPDESATQTWSAEDREPTTVLGVDRREATRAFVSGDQGDAPDEESGEDLPPAYEPLGPPSANQARESAEPDATTAAIPLHRGDDDTPTEAIRIR